MGDSHVSDWRAKTIGEIADVKGGKRLPKGEGLTESPNSHPYIRVTDLDDGRVKVSNILYVPETVFPKIKKYVVTQKDVIISIVGSIGLVATVSDELSGANLTENAAKICNISAEVDKDFLAYFLRSDLGQHEIFAQTVGSTQPKLALFRIKNINLPIPPISTQRRIAHILDTLDNKIELNRRTNATLEGIARAIFKSWFVDFDPVRAKLDGCDPGLPKEIADLFPDSFEDSELGKIPRGWGVVEAGKAVDAVGGGTPSTKNPDYWEGGQIAFATPKDLSGLESPILLDTEKRVTEKGLSKISSGLLPEGTLLMSSRAPVGYLAIARIPVCINQGFIAMKFNGTVSNYYILNWAEANMSLLQSRASGTTFPELSKTNFRPIPVLVPNPEILHIFDRYAENLYSQIEHNLLENRTLAELRDALLPKLMRREIEVHQDVAP